MLSNKALSASKSVEPVYIEEVFSTYLYTGTAANQTIINGIQLGNSYSPGTAGGSGLFNGTNNYLSVPTGTALNLTGDFTIECWVYQTGAGVLPSIIGNGAYPTTSQIALIISGSTPVFYLSSGSGWVVAMASSIPVSLNTWTHLAVSCSGSTFGIWVNGIYAGTATYSGARATPSATTLIGRLYTDTDNYYFPGYISNFRLVNGIAIYTGTSNFTVPSSALTAVSGTALLCLQGGSPFVDNSANALTITNNNSTTASGLGPFPFTLVPGKGGLTWIKARSSATNNLLFDTVRGATKFIRSDSTGAQVTQSETLTYFNSNGFSLGADNAGWGVNLSGVTYASWTFREQAKFFDIVTWSGTGSGITINHNLGSVPGMIILKKLSGPSGTGNWGVWHRGLPTSPGSQQYESNVFLNLTDQSDAYQYLTAAPTSTTFSLKNDFSQSSCTYVAYLFAHDAGGFGAAGTDNVISCGSYTGNGSTTGPVINLGYEPQWIMYKQVSSSGNNWFVVDNMRGLPVNGTTSYLIPNSTAAEGSGLGNILNITATGFQLKTTAASANESGATYIYMAIRRGPMKTPTSGTSVFSPVARTGNATSNTTVTAGFPVDMFWNGIRDFAGEFPTYFDRLRGNDLILFSNATSAEFSTASVEVAFNRSNANTGVQIGVNNNGINGNGYGYVDHFFRRAPGFFDQVCYTGTGSDSTDFFHNLGVVPELIIFKRRSGAATGWGVWTTSVGTSNSWMFLNTNAAVTDNGVALLSSTPTSTKMNLSTWGGINASSATYVAYLFATVAGVSKVGSYTGTGATQTINAGLPTGARFVLIKRTDSTGDWWVWDTARGMVAGTDPRLTINDTIAEINNNWVYTVTNGFQIVTSDATVNANGGTYIYLAIA